MAAEDYFAGLDPWLDAYDVEEPPEGWHAHYAWQAPRTSHVVRRVQIDVPGSVTLSSLKAGETFRFANAVHATNVYMVIASKTLDDLVVNYVLLNNGCVYSSHPTKRVIQVDVRMTIDTQSGRVMV